MATILVVDDDPETRRLLNSILGEDLGHRLLFAADGEVGIETYRRTRPDLVITDLVMPHLHGIRMIEHIRVVYPESRIIAISGKAVEQLDRAKAAGAIAALAKPIQREELLFAVDGALSDADPWKWVR